MPERYEIRGQDLPDGNKSLSPKDIYNVNKNFETVGLEVFGNADFTRKIKKEVDDLAETITTRVGSIEENYSTITQTAQMIEGAVMGEFTENMLLNYSTLTQTADAISTAVVNKADKSEIIQTATDLTLKFSSSGGGNHISNGNFANGLTHYAFYFSNDPAPQMAIKNDYYTNNEPTLELIASLSGTVVIANTYISGLTVGKTYTVGCLLAGHRGNNRLEVRNFADTQDIVWSNSVLSGEGVVNGWTPAVATFVATEPMMRLHFKLTSVDANGLLWAKAVRCNEGTELLPYIQNSNESYSTSYKFNGIGFEMKDSNGGVLIEVAKGIANEQNFGRASNVEDGYPMKLPFNIGAEVSQITTVLLKWDISPFRTDSKGSASGGGVKTTPEGGGKTSGASSRSTTDQRWNGSNLTFDASGAYVASVPGVHGHAIDVGQFAHDHIMTHTHTTADHSHAVDITHGHEVEFGILENPNITDYVIGITIDGVWRTSVAIQRGEVDLSTWITTNGWHEILLSVNGMKRLDANLFIKSYIRR